MNPTPSDAALIDSAVVAIRDLLSRLDDDACHPPIERPDEIRAIQRCLTSAAALLGVSRTLVLKPIAPTPLETVRHWDALVEQTKTAGRAAYEAALILADVHTA
ncbi:hypothetical protein [Variovorax sp. N23]|uniref:hypothetical protein n=1 Tax=Variovorax sp. N23 TaxID=2980555 RepID=UPI0021C78CBE|nr:hypothetical protein [Variovorax sp. N23]MCU4120620.1 hypothetical protein [Variovorax sp. N23]